MPQITKPDAMASFVCQHCSRHYTSKNILVRHLKSHEAVKRHGCNVCGRTFERADMLRRHARLHDNGTLSQEPGGRNVACSHCQRSKIKCEGGRPCKACISKRKHCPVESGNREPTVVDMLKAQDTWGTIDGDIRGATMHASLVAGNDIIRADDWMLADIGGGWQDLFESRSPPISSPGRVSRGHVLVNRTTTLPDLESILRPLSYAANEAQQSVIQTLSHYVQDHMFDDVQTLRQDMFYLKTSAAVSRAFELTLPAGSISSHLLDYLFELFQLHFADIDAILRDEKRVLMPPAVYLSACALGALKLSNASQLFGIMLHESLRNTLSKPVISMIPPAVSQATAWWLLESLHLQTCVAVSFAQPRSLTHIRELLDKTVLLVRSRKLFSRQRLDETQKALVFGVFRAGVILSVLTDERPQVSYEEIILPLSSLKPEMPFCDLVSSTLTGNGSLSEMLLDSNEVQMLSYAIHEIAWRHQYAKRQPISCLRSSTEGLQRAGLKRALARLACPAALGLAEDNATWNRLMEAQLAVRLAHIRLTAPLTLVLDTVHRIHGMLSMNDTDIIDTTALQEWLTATEAKEAVEWAVESYEFMTLELKDRPSQASQIGPGTGLWAGILLHSVAAVLYLWAHYKQSNEEKDDQVKLWCNLLGKQQILTVCAADFGKIIDVVSEIAHSYTCEGSLGRALMDHITSLLRGPQSQNL